MVATPIGNLGDMVPRAVETLQSVALIAAEDTRRTAHLCRHFQISTPLRSYHDHNEQARALELLAVLQSGDDLALVSDAGTPLISDPGFRLVSLAREREIDVCVVPGACAAIAALAGSGLPSDRFLFLGFPPVRARMRWFAEHADESSTLLFYESSHRILASLVDMQEVFGPVRRACVAREITKQYESWKTGSLAEILSWMKDDENQQRGEFVVVIEGIRNAASAADSQIEHHMRLLLKELSLKKAAALTAELLGVGKNRCYQVGLQISAD